MNTKIHVPEKLHNMYKISGKQPPIIMPYTRKPVTMDELSNNFAFSCISFDKYIEQLKNERNGLNLVPAEYFDPETGEKYIEMITQKEYDARAILKNFHYELINEDVPTYDELMIDSDEEEKEFIDSDYDDDDYEWTEV